MKLDDGEFEALFIKYPDDPVEMNSLLSSLLAQEEDPEHMYYFRASEFHIKADQETPWTLDGENGGFHTEGRNSETCPDRCRLLRRKKFPCPAARISKNNRKIIKGPIHLYRPFQNRRK